VSTSEEFQTALRIAQGNGQDDVIYLDAGTYYGGFKYVANDNEDYSLTIKTEPGLSPHDVIIDGGGTNTGIYIWDNPSPTTPTHTNNHFTLEGLTIRNCKYEPHTDEDEGGGIKIYSFGLGTITLKRNIIEGNQSKHPGGGVYIYSWSTFILLAGNIIAENASLYSWLTSGRPAVVIRCYSWSCQIEIRDNIITENDGGISVRARRGSISIRNNAVLKNNSRGIRASLSHDGDIIIEDNTVTRNTHRYHGAGIYVHPEEGSAILRNNVVTENVACWCGAGVTASTLTGRIILINNTIVGNVLPFYLGNERCYGDGGGVHTSASTGGKVYFYNNIIWGNKAEYYPESDDISIYGWNANFYMYNNDYHALYVWPYSSCNVIEGANIDEDPLFAGDYHLQPNSPCIDAGLNDVQAIPEIDKDGGERIVNGIVDIGAYEYKSKIELEPGDLLFCRSCKSVVPGYWTHVGMYIGGGQVVEALSDKGVAITSLESWNFPNKTCVAYARVINANNEIKGKAVSFAINQLYKPYDNPFFPIPSRKQSNPDSGSWYCSELVWAAYLNASDGQIDIEYTPDNFGITPKEIYIDDDIEEIGGHRENCSRVGLFFYTHSPVDISVVDPNGLIVNKEISEIPGAIYAEDDLDNDGDLDDWIGIPEPEIGTYQIMILPEPSASLEETYDFEVGYGEKFFIWAKNTPISKIPEEPYLIQLTEEGIQITSPVGDLDNDGDVDQNDLNILLTYRNQPASACPECDIDGDGVITVLDARKLVLLCTRPRCATE